MQNYAEYGFGLILVDTEIDDFIKIQDDWGDDETPDAAQFSTKICCNIKHTICFFGEEYDGKYYTLLNKESNSCYTDMLIINTIKQPDIFKPAYHDINEIITELKEEFIFPDDFDWKKHLGYYEGTISC